MPHSNGPGRRARREKQTQQKRKKGLPPKHHRTGGRTPYARALAAWQSQLHYVRRLHDTNARPHLQMQEKKRLEELRQVALATPRIRGRGSYSNNNRHPGLLAEAPNTGAYAATNRDQYRFA